MKKFSKFSSFIFMLLFFVLFYGCGGNDKEQSKNDAESGNDGDVSEVEELDDENADDDGTQEAVSEKPGEDFYEPSQEAVFSFKGIINLYETASAGNGTDGVIDFSLKYENEEMDMTDYPLAFIANAPVDNTEGSENKDFIYVNTYGNIEQNDGVVSYYSFSLRISVEKLLEFKENEIREFTATQGGASGSLIKYSYKKRIDDSVVRKRCIYGTLKEDESKIFVNHANNKSFEAGENFIAYGNIGLSPEIDPGKLADYYELYDDLYCMFMLDDEIISKERYEEEFEKDLSTLDCELPENFSENDNPSKVVMTVRGKINEEGTQDSKCTATYDMTLNGEKIEVSDYLVISTREKTTFTEDVVTIQSLGGVTAISGNSYYSYNYFSVYVPTELLTAALEENTEKCLIESDEVVDRVFVQLTEVEEKDMVSDSYQRYCVKATVAPLPAESKVFFCIGGNTSFEAGEEVQFAGNLTLSDDKDYLKEQLQVQSDDELCECYKNYNTEIECSEFEALNPA